MTARAVWSPICRGGLTRESYRFRRWAIGAILFLVLCLLARASNASNLDNARTDQLVVGWNLIAAGPGCHIADQAEAPLSMWQVEGLNKDASVWIELDHDNLDGNTPGSIHERTYWIYSSRVQTIALQCGQKPSFGPPVPGWNLASGHALSSAESSRPIAFLVWDSSLQSYRSLDADTDLNPSTAYWALLDPNHVARVDAARPHANQSTSSSRSPDFPPRLQALLEGKEARLYWSAPKRLVNRTPIPEDVRVLYRVYMDGKLAAETLEQTYKHTLADSEAHRFYVTASVIDENGQRWESDRSERIEMAPTEPIQAVPNGAFEYASWVAEAKGAALPQGALNEHGGTLFSYVVFVVRDFGSGSGDEIRFRRSKEAGRGGSFEPGLVLMAGSGKTVTDLRLSVHREQVVLAWLQSDAGAKGRSQIYALFSEDGGASWPEAPQPIRSDERPKRGLGLAHDILGDVHLVFGEEGKVYYLRNFRGEPNNVFDQTWREPQDETVHYKAHYDPKDSGCDCPECWCKETYELSDVEGPHRTWTEEASVYEPSLFVDGTGIHIIGRRLRMWDNVPVKNPAWFDMVQNPIFSEEIVQRKRPTKLVVGWRKTWKRSKEVGDERALHTVGHHFQYLYDGSLHEEDHIVLASRPLAGGAWSHGPEPWEGGTWSKEGALQNWRLTSIDVIEGEELNDRPSHPTLSRGPDGRLFAAYERGAQANPNRVGENAIVLTHSSDDGRTWSSPQKITTGYLPRLATTSNTLAVMAYVPRPTEAPERTPQGSIEVLLSSDGATFDAQTVNRVWASAGPQSVPASPIHPTTHGDGAPLSGVPMLFAHEDLLTVMWVGSHDPLGRGGALSHGVWLSRAATLDEQQVKTQLALISSDQMVSGAPQAVQVRVENQYHMAVDAKMGSLRIDPSPPNAGGAFRTSEGGTPSAAAAFSTGHSIESASAHFWTAFENEEPTLVLAAQSDLHPTSAATSFKMVSGNGHGNHQRALTIRDKRYNARNGAQREFLPEPNHPDTAHLAKHERVWVYTQGIALAQAARQGLPRAYPLARWLCDHAVRDQNDPDTILGWHFSHNTRDDDWKDFRLVTGATTWAIHGLGHFLTSDVPPPADDGAGRFGLDDALACYQAALRGLLKSQTDSGLFTAGFSASALAAAPGGIEYYQVLDELGYDDATPRIRATNVVTEHNLDALSVLNHALHHDAALALDDEVIRSARNALRRALFHELWDPHEKRMITGGEFRKDGGFVQSRFSAVDNCSWLSLSVDYASLKEEEINQIALCLHYTIAAFVKELPFTDDPQDRRYLGTHYFPADFKDPYIDLTPAEQAQQPKSYHLEATSGVILGLWRFAHESGHQDARHFQGVGDDLWSGMQRFVRDHGFPYSSQRIHNLSTTLESSTAAIWFIDVWDDEARRQRSADRPLKSYARAPITTNSLKQVAWGDTDSEPIWTHAVTAKMLREDLSQAEASLNAQTPQNSHVADQAIWNPEYHGFFDEQTYLHNIGQVDASQFDVDIDMPEAWSIVRDPGDFVVAVVDSGFKPDLADLNYWQNPGEIPGDDIDNDKNGHIDDTWGWDFFDNDNHPRGKTGHGTTVARWLAAHPDTTFSGVAPGAQVMALRQSPWPYMSGIPVLEMFTPRTQMAQIIHGMEYATAMRRRHNQGLGGADVRVINLSLGLEISILNLLNAVPAMGLGHATRADFMKAIQSANDAGIVVVAAASNKKDVISIPAELWAENFLGVFTSDAHDQPVFDSGNGLEIAAPTYHYSVSSGEPKLGAPQGNSLAAPLVSGAALLAWRVAPDATPKQIRQAIMDGVDRRPSLEGKAISGGRLNVFRALQHLRLAQFEPLPKKSAGKASAIEDKIEQPGADVRYILRLEPGEPLHVTVEPLWLDADIEPTLRPRLEMVQPNGERRLVAAQSTGDSITIGPLATMNYYGDPTYQFFISGLDDSTGPFRLRVHLGQGGPTEAVATPAQATSLEERALRTLAWLALFDHSRARNEISGLLSMFDDAPAADQLLGLYALLQAIVQTPGKNYDENLFTTVEHKLPALFEPLLDPGSKNVTDLAAWVYGYFVSDLATQIFLEDHALAGSVGSWRRLIMERLLALRGHAKRDHAFETTSGGGSSFRPGDRLLFGLFLLDQGDIETLQMLLSTLEPTNPPQEAVPSARWTELPEALLLLYRALGSFDSRLEEMALASMVQSPASQLLDKQVAVRVLAHLPTGIFGIRAGPSAWTPRADHPPEHTFEHRSTTMNVFSLGLDLTVPFRDALYALLASDRAPHTVDHWVERLDQIRFAYAQTEAKRLPFEWLEAYEFRNRDVEFDRTLWDLSHLCEVPMLHRVSEIHTFEDHMGLSCSLASATWEAILRKRLGGQRANTLNHFIDRAGESLRFNQLIQTLHDPLPSPKDLLEHRLPEGTFQRHQGIEGVRPPYGLALGTMPRGGGNGFVPRLFDHYVDTCLYGRHAESPEFCQPLHATARPEEVPGFLRNRLTETLHHALQLAAQKPMPVAFQLWRVDTVGALNPGSPMHWHPTEAVFRMVANAEEPLDLEWWYSDIPLQSYDPQRALSVADDARHVRRIINDHAEGDPLRVANLVDRSPNVVHRWMRTGTISTTDFEVLSEALGPDAQGPIWAAHLRTPDGESGRPAAVSDAPIDFQLKANEGTTAFVDDWQIRLLGDDPSFTPWEQASYTKNYQVDLDGGTATAEFSDGTPSVVLPIEYTPPNQPNVQLVSCKGIVEFPQAECAQNEFPLRTIQERHAKTETELIQLYLPRHKLFVLVPGDGDQVEVDLSFFAEVPYTMGHLHPASMAHLSPSRGDVKSLIEASFRTGQRFSHIYPPTGDFVVTFGIPGTQHYQPDLWSQDRHDTPWIDEDRVWRESTATNARNFGADPAIDTVAYDEFHQALDPKQRRPDGGWTLQFEFADGAFTPPAQYVVLYPTVSSTLRGGHFVNVSHEGDGVDEHGRTWLELKFEVDAARFFEIHPTVQGGPWVRDRFQVIESATDRRLLNVEVKVVVRDALTRSSEGSPED